MIRKRVTVGKDETQTPGDIVTDDKDICGCKNGDRSGRRILRCVQRSHFISSSVATPDTDQVVGRNVDVAVRFIASPSESSGVEGGSLVRFPTPGQHLGHRLTAGG